MANVQDIRIEDYNYPLPDERIAKHPIEERDKCKLLYYKGGKIEEHVFNEITDLLPENSTLVYNNTRVINARLRFRKPGGGALIEIFCLEPLMPRDYAQVFATTSECTWLCFVGNSKRWKTGALTLPLTVDGETVTLSAERDGQSGNAFKIRFSWDNPQVTFASILDAVGEIPIPPYLNRSTEPSDSQDYQTVYSHIEGSVAAPTAGLHFTQEVLDAISRRGIARKELTLHVGAGTFQPVKSDVIGGHEMHTEFISVNLSSIERIKANLGHIIAVGTTSVRTLESAASEEGRLEKLTGNTDIFIHPGYTFRFIDDLLTNFHTPESTLLMLVSALAGRENMLRAYSHAIEERYRFFSYGDACFIRG